MSRTAAPLERAGKDRGHSAGDGPGAWPKRACQSDRRNVTKTQISSGTVNQVTGDPTAVRSVAGGPAGWAFTWHQCAPGCGQEIWLSADGIEWDRLKMINSAKAGSFVVPSGISVGATAIVLAGISYDTSPYTGVNPVVLWVGSIG